MSKFLSILRNGQTPEPTTASPITGAIQRANATALKGHETSKGTVRFPLAEPLPVPLIRRLVRARIVEVRTAVAAKRRTPVKKEPR